MEHLDEEERQYAWNEVEDSLSEGKIDQFRAEFLELHPYDQAKVFEELEEELRQVIYTYVSPKEMADVMEHVEHEESEPYFSEMDPRFASEVFAEMSSDDAVDILNQLEKDKVASFLTIMNKEDAQEIKDLLHYEEKTAGSIMTTEYVSLKASMKVREAMEHLRTEAPDAETIYYTYVVDDDKKLAGVISLRDLIISEPDWTIEEAMSDRVVSVSVAKDQEEIAQMMRDYDFLALPVVDFQDHLLGIITVDDIMDVMDEEASDDYSKLAGISDVDGPNDNAFTSAKKRLPWLIILLFLGSLTASLISQFEAQLNQVAILAIFIPLIAGMAGNTGTQALAVAIRGIATGEIRKQGKMRMMLREASTGLITGVVCGVIITLVVYVWQGNFFLGLLVGISVMSALIVATIAGAFVPLIMDRLNIDPAVASGPFITTINDLISILIYFGMASAFMNLLV
ncbi:magnesium transporter [Salimicrobium jeotgali]|uniref:Magnesium transporter MgtE n=1 Tax=Salimicrobium jeotgali TaxID=1230341 RepID=K2GML1_9BACI|nr:magnesium transporter [Salimicrobium jeotgali]AKG04950.1 magnesium transporter [Salimicrobium jeotgali]EKE31629.1 magnesium MgtE family transporter [Salimicrobium jeotgali]MBM7696450.1 magnesium transporter [Salimicrobium jeotgali]